MALTNEEKTLKLKVELDIARTNANAKRLKKTIEDLDGRTVEYKEAVAKLNFELQKNVNAKQKLSQINTQITSTQRKFGEATGNATAAAMELGRVVSDAPYGIRGMANNVSQLASILLMEATATDAATGATKGFVGAIKSTWAALMGPLGVLLAIQAVISAVDYFYGSTKKAEEGTKDLNKELKNQIDIFRLYDEQLKDNNLSLEERLKTLNAVSKLDKDLGKKLKAAGDDMEKQTKVLENYRKQKEVELKLKEQEVVLIDAIEKAKKATAEADKERTAKAVESAKVVVGATGGFAGMTVPPKGITQTLEKSKAIIEEEEAQKRLNEALKAYRDLLNLLEDDKTPEGARRAKIFKENLLDLEKQIIGFNKSRLLAEAQGEEESRRIRQKFERDELKRVRDAYIRKEKLRLDNYSKEQDAIINNENSTTAQVEQAEQNKLNAIRTFNNEKLQSQEQYNEASKALGNKHTAENAAADAALRDQKRLHDAEMQNLQAQMDAWVKENGIVVQKDLFDENQAKLEADKKYWEDKRDAAEEGSKEYLEAVKKAKQLEVNITNNAAEREKAIEQAKFDFKIGIMEAISSSLGSLSILAKEGSDLSKALALAQIGVDTATGLMAGLRIAQQTAEGTGPAAAFAMPLFYAQQVAAVLGAAAQAKRIINSGGSGSATSPSAGGGDGGGTTFRPDFNIVGASGQNQLAATVAGQVGEPTRAYVVYDDLRTAGEIEANAVEAAGI